MATNNKPIFLNTLVTAVDTIVPADTTATKTMLTAGADGAGVTNLTAASDDTSTVTLVIKIDGVQAGEVVVPIGAGTDGSTPAKNLLDSTAMPGLFQADGSLLLGPLAVLTVNAKATITAAKTVSIILAGGSYSA
jgi:hypothetical protein